MSHEEEPWQPSDRMEFLAAQNTDPAMTEVFKYLFRLRDDRDFWRKLAGRAMLMISLPISTAAIADDTTWTTRRSKTKKHGLHSS